MALVTENNESLAGITKLIDPKGDPFVIAEVLEQMHAHRRDIVWKPCNDGLVEQVAIRASYPVPTWIFPGEGVVPSYGTVRNAVFNTGLLRSYCEIPKDHLAFKDSADTAVKMAELTAHTHGMENEHSRVMFYGDRGKNPREFNGIAQYYNSKSKNNADAIIDAGGTGAALRDIWIFGWSTETVYMVYPEGKKGYSGGLQRTVETLDTNTSSKRPDSSSKDGYKPIHLSRYDWWSGLVLKNWQYVIRIANINTAAGSVTTDIPLWVLRGVDRLKSRDGVRTAIYSDRRTLELADEQSRKDVMNSTLKWEDVYGRGIKNVTVQGIPWHYVDALDTNVAQVT